MKTILLILVTFMLTGCMWQTIEANDIKRAIDICNGVNATVASISSHFDGNGTVTCSNYIKYSLSVK